MEFFKKTLIFVLMLTALVESFFGSASVACIARTIPEPTDHFVMGHIYTECKNTTIESAEVLFNINEVRGGDMTATYSFFNNSEQDEIIRCLTPTNDGNVVVTVDGTKVDTTMRYAFNAYQTRPIDNIYLIKDNYKDDWFYKPDLSVTKYSYKVIADAYANSLKISTLFDRANTVFYFKDGENSLMQGNKCICYFDLSKSEDVTFYAIGEDFTEDPILEFKKEGNDNHSQSTIEFLGKEVIEFSELALSERSEEVSEIDWYNAVVDCFMMWGNSMALGDFIDIKEYLVGWAEYYIEVKANSRVVNEINMPVKCYKEGYDAYYVFDLSCVESISNEKITVKIITPFYCSGQMIDYDSDTQMYVRNPTDKAEEVIFWIEEEIHPYNCIDFSFFEDFAYNFLARLVFFPLSFALIYGIGKAYKRKSN